MSDSTSIASRLLCALALLLATLAAPAAEAPRIVSQSPYLTQSLQWLGLDPYIVGVSRYDELDRPRTGGVLDPDAAAIEALQPSLLFASDWTPRKALPAAAAGVHIFRLGGFEHMSQIEENLRIMGQAAGVKETPRRVEDFHHQWREKAAALRGNKKTFLMLYACSATPYTVGRGEWLSELLEYAGFSNAETSDKARVIGQQDDYPTIDALIAALRPDVLFALTSSKSRSCPLAAMQAAQPVVFLDAALFLFPSPVILQGLDALAAQRQLWD